MTAITSEVQNRLESATKSINESPLPGCVPQRDSQHPHPHAATADITKTRICNELELCYKELVKCREIEANKASIPYQKLQHHDPDKWKKKLKMLLDRERIVTVEGHPIGAFDLKKAAK